MRSDLARRLDRLERAMDRDADPLEAPLREALEVCGTQALEEWLAGLGLGVDLPKLMEWAGLTKPSA